MKNMCNIIGDILPLYVEGLTSDETNEFVQEHLCGCENCRKAAESIKANINVANNIESVPLKNIREQLKKRRLKLIALTVFILIIAVFTVFDHLTSRRYIPYNQSLVKITADFCGTNQDEAIEHINQPVLLITFDEQVTGYDIEESFAEDGKTKIYTISAWSTPLDKMLKKGTQHTVIDESDSTGFWVFYNQNNGAADALLYNNVQYCLDNARVSLPRLFLGYYFIIALIFAALSGVIMFIFREKSKVREVMEKILLIPVSYMIGHLCLKPLAFTSYNAEIDLLKIVLISIPVYFALNIIADLIKSRTAHN